MQHDAPVTKNVATLNTKHDPSWRQIGAYSVRKPYILSNGRSRLCCDKSFRICESQTARIKSNDHSIRTIVLSIPVYVLSKPGQHLIVFGIGCQFCRAGGSEDQPIGGSAVPRASCASWSANVKQISFHIC
jgi:hypothetical protein